MKCIDRYNEFKSEPFDKVILYIKKGIIKSGKYSNLIKINKNEKINRKDLFSNV